MYLTILLILSLDIVEVFFTGALNGLIIGILSYIYFAVKEKKEKRKQKIIEAKDHELSYYDTLQEIVNSKNVKMEFDYYSTYEELIELCNPKYYLESCDKERLSTAIDIYSKLLKCHPFKDKGMIIKLRKEAVNNLQVKLNAKKCYCFLMELFNPAQYVDDNFDSVKLLACNKAYSFISENKNDLRALQNFALRIGLLKL